MTIIKIALNPSVAGKKVSGMGDWGLNFYLFLFTFLCRPPLMTRLS